MASSSVEDVIAPSDPLPRWDLTTIFPSVDGPEVRQALQDLLDELGALRELFDRHDVRGGSGPTPNGSTAATFDEVLAALNTMLEDNHRLEAFAYGHVSSDATNEAAQQLISRLQTLGAELSVLRGRFDAWVRRIGAEDLIGQSTDAAAHAWPLTKASRRAAHQMSEPEEALAADLGVTGSTAWSRLYEDVTSGVKAEVTFPDGTVKALPIFAVRGMATNADETLRAAAFRAELAAWEANAVPIAAALNAIKGETLTLGRRRGWDDPLDTVLEANAVDRPTLEAMSAAVDEALPDFRRYLVAKAPLLGKSRLAFWDLFAPVGEVRPMEWSDSVAVVEQVFAGYSPELAGLAQRALAESWVDAGPRAGKVGGAFCMPIGNGESRVLMNFDGSIDAVHTLAHELGHAYHNQTLRDRTPLQRSTPMPLAETASIFCETILTDRALEAATSDGERLALLEVDLQGACQVVVDIRSRFLFESRLFERRRESTVSPRELCDLMRQAQLDAYGDALDPDALHPYMWAAKPHYYGSTFYNWPYTFGLLFGLGLYARWREDESAFRANYDALLSSTGLATAADLATRFDIDLHAQSFWQKSLDVIRARIDNFESAAAAM